MSRRTSHDAMRRPTPLTVLVPVATAFVTMAPATSPLAASRYVAEGIGTLEEVVVTARRVEESQQDRPIAITALSGDALLDRQIFQTDQLTQVVPTCSSEPMPRWLATLASTSGR